MLSPMNQTSMTLLLAFALCLGGCGGKEKQPDTVAADVLGPNPVFILQYPTRVEGWNFQRPDGSIASDPPLHLLDKGLGRDLAKVLLAETTYATGGGSGAFERAVGYRMWRDDQSLDVILSFNNDQAQIKYGGYTNQPGANLVGIGKGRKDLLDITRKAFPEYRPPGK
jgi:hypothetical protein